ncbi:MAG: hypothetical protein ACQEWF_22455 [Bacillota bacterium]
MKEWSICCKCGELFLFEEFIYGNLVQTNSEHEMCPKGQWRDIG